MFSHVMVGSNDVPRSQRFYDALFSVMGARPAMQDEKGRLLYIHGEALFMVTTPRDGAPATHGNGATIGFALRDSGQVDAWHAAGVANGGTAIEDAPGVRVGNFGDLYLAYLRDPDGNKLCGAYRAPRGTANAG